MAKYNSINDVIAGHINNVITNMEYDAADYPFQNDINSAILQLAALYAQAAGEEVAVAQDAFSIAGALDVLLDVVDAVIAPGSTPTPTPTPEP